jgi:RHS repeat-associated protein
MKTYAVVAIVTTVLALGSSVRAQTCYTPVNSWITTFDLNGTVSGASCSGGTCNIRESASATDLSITPPGVSCSADTVEWVGTTSCPAGSATCSVNDTATFSSCDQDVFSGPTSNGFADSGLLVNVANNTYTYFGVAGGLGTFTSITCEGTTTTPLAVAVLPSSNWPITFTLPDKYIETLTGSAPPGYTALDSMGLGATVPYTFTFTLEPIYNTDDDCNENGGSTIGCQNQSLGEDVPVVGTGLNLHYESDRAPGASGNSAASADALMIGGWTLSVHHAYDPSTNTLFLGDGRQRNGYQLGTPVSFNGNLLLTSEDGSEVYVFTSAGQHLQTQRPLTGAFVYQFGYDSAGNLVTATDASGNVTTIQRNGSEQATAIVSPYGQTTTLSLDSNGFLSQVTDPLGKSAMFTNLSGGLLASRTDENGNVYNCSYDSHGRLAKDADPVGGYTALTRTNANSGLGWTVGQTTAMGRTSSFQYTLTLPWVLDSSSTASEQRAITWPNGLQATKSTSLQSGQLTNAFTLPDGTSDSTTLGPDPVWGLQVPISTSVTLTKGSLTMNASYNRSTTLGTPGNPFTVATQTDTEKINGRTYTSVFTGSSKTYVGTTPVKRKTTTVLDSLERVSSTQIGALLAIGYSYDGQGRLATIAQGTRTTALTHDSDGFLSSITDPLKLTSSFTHDGDGHVLMSTLPDGRVVTYTYDANGNLTSVTPPGKSAHSFSYTAVNLLATYTPPIVSGTGPTSYTYNLDRNLTSVTRPDSETIAYGYDSAGRLSSITTPTETANYAYDATAGNLSSASISGGEAITYGYNGPLPTSSTWTGTVAGSVSRAYNDNFWVTSESINNGNTINFTYDNDGLLTKAGSLVITNDPKDGLLKTVDLGSAKDSRTYDTYGELTGYTAKYGLTALYSLKFTRDADGRITTKAETVSGKKNTFTYGYDTAGRLTGVKENGSSISTYTYDTNSNRLSATTSSGTVTGTYDAQDRLLTYGNASYTYTANGELASVTAGSQTTTYSYDVLGNLIAATLPNGTKIAYVIDAENHRVGKEESGVLQSGFLYDGDRIAAQLNGSNQIVSQFIYVSGAISPDYVVTGGVTYRIFSDQLGSPRLVVNTSTGAIAEQINYDEFGNVTSDTNPSFQPFGFAGGLYDQDTKLVRFGARDYSPAIGRWTAKDPALFEGSDTNLYAYVFNDPVNLTDSSGLDPDCDENKKEKSLKDKIKEWIKNKILDWGSHVGGEGLTVDHPPGSNEIGVSTGVDLNVGDTKVGSANGRVAVGVTDGGTPEGNLIYVDGKVTVSGPGGVEVEVAHVHAEGVDATKWQHTQNLLSDAEKADQQYKQAICENNCN